MLFQYYGVNRGLFQTLVDWGFVDAILPFILIFVLIFAILQKIEIFKNEQGKPDRKINGILGMIIAAMIVVPHVVGLYPPETDPILIIMQFLPQATVLLVVILVVLLLLGQSVGVPNLVSSAIALGALVVLLFVILAAVLPGFFPAVPFTWLRDPATQAILVILLVMGLIGWFIIRPDTGGGGLKGFIDDWMKKT